MKDNVKRTRIVKIRSPYLNSKTIASAITFLIHNPGFHIGSTLCCGVVTWRALGSKISRLMLDVVLCLYHAWCLRINLRRENVR